MKIHVSKLIDKVSKGGKPYLLQRVRMSQFPHDDVTIWKRPFSAEQAYPEGLFDADIYVREYQATDKTTGEKVTKQEICFENFRTIDAE